MPSSRGPLHPRPERLASTRGKLGMPLSQRKALKPIAPASRNPARRSRFPGTRPPHRPKSTQDFRSASARFSRQARRVEGRRLRIEGHVEKGRAASGRERDRSRRQPLPLRSPRLVEMHMGIEDAGEDIAVVSSQLGRGSIPGMSGAISTIRPSFTPRSA